MAEAAAAQLRASVDKLSTALTADDQVTALAEVVSGYEQGQAALREGLRQAALREAELRTRFESQRESLSDVLGVMMAMERSPETALLLHPAGGTATARAGMILSAVTPGLRAEAEKLQADLDEIAAVRELQANAATMLGDGLASVQEARRLLTSAVTDRSTMPVRFGDDPEELQQLQASASSLDDFRAGYRGDAIRCRSPDGGFRRRAGQSAPAGHRRGHALLQRGRCGGRSAPRHRHCHRARRAGHDALARDNPLSRPLA